jgi:hypothetical protein
VHKRILLRARKGPFDVAAPEATLERNLIGTNSGNVVFLQAAYKLLATNGSRIETYGGRPDPADAERINESHDVFVVPLANAFRPTFEPHLMALTRLIERLRIPVVILGVGAQSNLDYEMAALKPVERSVKAFVRTVLDHSPSIGVRGEFSQHYLQSLGFREVEVIGCPSMFLNGERLEVRRKRPSLEPHSRLAINISPGIPQMAGILARHLAKYSELVYVAQDLDTLALLVWREAPLGARTSDAFPLDLEHPLFRENKVRYFVDPWPWIDFLRDFDFTFGSRIHGNMVALLAGTPAYVLAHDSRTLELARYFQIPHTRIDQLPAALDAARLHDEADYGDLIAGHRLRFATFTTFLHSHGLEHVYSKGQDPRPFEQRVAATAYPPAVSLATSPTTGGAFGLRRLSYAARRVSRSTWARRLRAAANRGLVPR